MGNGRLYSRILLGSLLVPTPLLAPWSKIEPHYANGQSVILFKYDNVLHPPPTDLLGDGCLLRYESAVSNIFDIIAGVKISSSGEYFFHLPPAPPPKKILTAKYCTNELKS